MNDTPKFGTAGLSDSYAAKGFDPQKIAAYTASFGLTAFEYQCGRGVRLAHDKAQALGKAAAAQGITLSVHAPYYISMSGLDDEKRLHSVDYLLQSCALVKALGGRRVVFHPGFYGSPASFRMPSVGNNAVPPYLCPVYSILFCVARAFCRGYTLPSNRAASAFAAYCPARTACCTVLAWPPISISSAPGLTS